MLAAWPTLSTFCFISLISFLREEDEEMERQKNSRVETSKQGQRSSEEDLLSAGKKNAPDIDNTERESTPKSESVGGGSQASKPPCKGFMQKCKEMVVGYLAPSTSTTRNDNPEAQGESQADQAPLEYPEHNLGEGNFLLRPASSKFRRCRLKSRFWRVIKMQRKPPFLETP